MALAVRCLSDIAAQDSHTLTMLIRRIMASSTNHSIQMGRSRGGTLAHKAKWVMQVVPTKTVDKTETETETEVTCIRIRSPQTQHKTLLVLLTLPLLPHLGTACKKEGRKSSSSSSSSTSSRSQQGQQASGLMIYVTSEKSSSRWKVNNV